MMNRTLATVLSAALAIGTPSVVFAQDETGGVEAEFKDVTTQASEAYSAGDYDRAIALFEKAYEIKPVSNILYNIARIHEDAGHIDEAIEYYDAFVVAPNVEQTARRDALDRLKTLREVKALKEGEQEAPARTTDREPEPDPEPAPEPAETEPQPEPRPSTGRTVGWVFLGVGGASLIGAGVFGLLAQSKFDDFESATSLQDRRAAASAGRTNAVVADSLLVAGAVTAAVGAVFLIVASSGGETDTRADNTWTVSPLVGGDALGLGLGLDF